MSRKRNKVMKNSSGCHDINKVIRFFLIPFKNMRYHVNIRRE